MCMQLMLPSVDQYETPAAAKWEIINYIEYNSVYWHERYSGQPTTNVIKRLPATAGGRPEMVCY